MRNHYWDCWKGLAIIAVVLIHSACANGFLVDDGSANVWVIVARQCVNFAVALFLFVSGYFSLAAPRLCRRRLPRLLCPYLAWTCAYLIIRHSISGVGAADIVRGVVLGTGISVGYFVIVLAQLILLTPMLSAIQRQSWHIAVMVASALGGLCYVYYLQVFAPELPISAFPYYAIPFFVWMPFYHLGYFLRRYQVRLSAVACAGLYAIALALSVAEALHWAPENRALAASQLKVTSYSASTALCLLVFACRDKLMLRSRPLAWVGEHSYPIYLSHMLVLSVLASAFSAFSEYQPLYILACAVAVMVSCAAGVLAAQKLVPHRVRRFVVGA